MSSTKQVVAVLGLLAGGCASSPTSFRPTEFLSAVSLSGQLASLYDLGAPEGQMVIGELKVWSEGARTEGAPFDFTHLKIGVELENNGTTTLAIDLDRTVVEWQDPDIGVVRAIHVESPTKADPTAPRTDTSLLLDFEMPLGVKPGDIEAFRVRWSIRSGDSTYERSTAFVRRDDSTHAYWAVRSSSDGRTSRVRAVPAACR